MTENNHRILRIISIWTLVPAFALNIAHGVTFHTVLPAVGLIPHVCSVLLAMYDLGWFKHWYKEHEYRLLLQTDSEEDKPSTFRNFIVLLLDTITGLSLTGCFIGSYFVLHFRGGRYYWKNEIALFVLGTYATLPYIVNA